MFTRQPEYIKKIASIIGRNSFLKDLLRPLYEGYLRTLTHHRNKLFIKNGVQVLHNFDKCMTENGFKYTLAFGTMLGAVREHGFIKHDLDLDVAMWAEDYNESIKECLKKYGFKLRHELLVDNGTTGREETYELNGVSIDIFYIYPALDRYPYCCDFISVQGTVSFIDSMKKFGYIRPRRIQLPWGKKYIRIPFENLKLPIPENAHEILSFRYGKDYMTPNPNWHYTDANKYTTEWEGKKGIMKK